MERHFCEKCLFARVMERHFGEWRLFLRVLGLASAKEAFPGWRLFAKSTAMRSPTLAFPFFLAAAPFFTGCATTGNGTFKPDGFHQDDYPYVIHYANPG